MGDIWNIHNLWLTYGMYATNGRRTEHSRFTVDIQGTSALQKMVRTPKTNKPQKNYLSEIGINFATLSPTT